MPIEVILVGAGGKRINSTENGALVVAAALFDDTEFVELAEPNTAYNFYPPKVGKQFVITSFNMKADRDVSNTIDAFVVIYEASTLSSISEDRVLYQDALVRGERSGLSPTNILVNEGKFINAKTTDDDIFMTITGYYIPKVGG